MPHAAHARASTLLPQGAPWADGWFRLPSCSWPSLPRQYGRVGRRQVPAVSRPCRRRHEACLRIVLFGSVPEARAAVVSSVEASSPGPVVVFMPRLIEPDAATVSVTPCIAAATAWLFAGRWPLLELEVRQCCPDYMSILAGVDWPCWLQCPHAGRRSFLLVSATTLADVLGRLYPMAVHCPGEEHIPACVIASPHQHE